MLGHAASRETRGQNRERGLSDEPNVGESDTREIIAVHRLQIGYEYFICFLRRS